jgi:SAM-dependent methyltransferase
MISQEEAFVTGEADAWVRRNPESLIAAGVDDPVLAALAQCELPPHGMMLDVGGAAGRVAAGLRRYPGWKARVVEPSSEAIKAGQEAFPDVEFRRGTISQPLLGATPEDTTSDIVVVSGVLSWVERKYLSRAIANTDAALADGGLLVIVDFDSAYPRANPYKYRPGLFTFKQDYPACYMALGIYHVMQRHTHTYDCVADPSDPYDQHSMTAVLRKDLVGRYARSAQSDSGA